MRARLPRAALALLVALVVGAPALGAALGAQQQDSTRAAVSRRPTTRADSTVKPPISPRRAFFASLLIPGYGQARLDRDKAGTIFVAAEIVGIVMAQKSANDIRTARRHAADTVILGFKPASEDRVTLPDPFTGEMVVPACPPGTNGPFQMIVDTAAAVGAVACASRYTADRIRARRTHYEDWIAFLVFNHLFSGADAFVAAQLWDLPTRVIISPYRGGALIGAGVSW